MLAMKICIVLYCLITVSVILNLLCVLRELYNTINSIVVSVLTSTSSTSSQVLDQYQYYYYY